MPQIMGWPYTTRAQKPGGWLSRVWPALRVVGWAQFAVVLVGAELLNSARLVSHVHAGAAVLASLGAMILFAIIEKALERLRLVEEQNPAQPAIDVAQVPPPPVPPPLADEAPRAPANPVPGGALPDRLGGAAWGFERGYVWKPPGGDRD